LRPVSLCPAQHAYAGAQQRVKGTGINQL
jgi:hypothetical protein